MTPRAHRALTHQYNAIDMTRRSPTYEQRLAKYADRGFAVLVPTLERNKIDPQLYERRFDQLQGMFLVMRYLKLKRACQVDFVGKIVNSGRKTEIQESSKTQKIETCNGTKMYNFRVISG
jgi:hypothetical protein